MTYLEQTAYQVKFERGERGLRAIAREASVLVVVDVLSFSTAVDIAISAGAFVKASTSSVCADEEARQFGALSAVSRKKRSDAMPYSLSPDTLSALPAGTRLILPSPNGATLISQAQDLRVPIIVTACLRNAEAVGEFVRVRAGGGIVAVVSAGERWSDGSLRPALEDDLGAGAVLACLNLKRASPEANTVSRTFLHAKGQISQTIEACVSGRELIERATRLTLIVLQNMASAIPYR
jgi:2-phosphosulfolactate phosphatase